MASHEYPEPAKRAGQAQLRTATVPNDRSCGATITGQPQLKQPRLQMNCAAGQLDLCTVAVLVLSWQRTQWHRDASILQSRSKQRDDAVAQQCSNRMDSLRFHIYGYSVRPHSVKILCWIRVWCIVRHVSHLSADELRIDRSRHATIRVGMVSFCDFTASTVWSCPSQL